MTSYIHFEEPWSRKNPPLKELMQAVIERGAPFRFCARGFSMYPFIRDRDMVTLVPLHLHRPLKVGDVVAFRQPDVDKLALHRIVQRKNGSFLIKGDNVPEPDGFIAPENILAVAVSVERKGRRVGGGLGPARGLLAYLSRHNKLRICNPLLPLIPFGYILRCIQGLKSYRKTIRHLLRPSILISEAGQADLEEAEERLGFMGSLSPHVTGFVARMNSKVVGFVDLVRHPHENNPYTGYWIFGLCVWLPCRGLGIGEALCRQAIARARSEGAEELSLLVYSENRAAVNLYRSLGFEPSPIHGLEKQLEEELKATGRRRMAMRLKLSS
jgi:ribosomal protein S18 acetylase RimI-like enzyme